MQIVPLSAKASQTARVTLSGQPCTLAVYQKASGLYMDVYSNDALVVGGVACLCGPLVVQNTYFGFVGDFTWIDTGAQPLADASDPSYDGIGSRWFLAYLLPSET